jgi:hypothetical protein
MNSAALNFGNNLLEFTVAHERVATDDGYVKRLVLIDEREDFANQLVSLEIGKLAENFATAEMGCVERVTAGAPEGTFFGDLDGHRGGTATQDSGPCLKDFGSFHVLSHCPGRAVAAMKEGMTTEGSPSARRQ